MRRTPGLAVLLASGACLALATLVSCDSSRDDVGSVTADLGGSDGAGSEAGGEAGNRAGGEGGANGASVLQACEQQTPDQCSSCIASSYCPLASGGDPLIALACGDVDDGWYTGGDNDALAKVLCGADPADPWLGATVDDEQWPLSPPSAQVVLLVTHGPLPPSADLTAGGYEFDWVAPGATQNRMLNAATCRPSNLLGVTASADAVPALNSAPPFFRWSDGTPMLATSALLTGTKASQFTITAPTVGTLARLALYVEGATNGGHLTATLDGSTVDDPTASQWGDGIAYVIAYESGTGGQLQVTWSGSSPVTLLAAQLQAMPDAPGLVLGAVASPAPPSLSQCFEQGDGGVDAGGDGGSDAAIDGGVDANADAGARGADGGELPVSPATPPVMLPPPPANVASFSFGVPWEQRVDSYYRNQLGVTTSTAIGNVGEFVTTTLLDYVEVLFIYPLVDSPPDGVGRAIAADCAGRADEPFQFIACAASRTAQYINATYQFDDAGRQVGGLRTYCRTYAAFMYDIIYLAVNDPLLSVGYMKSTVVENDGIGMIGPNLGHVLNYVTLKSQWSGNRSRFYYDAGHNQPVVFYPATALAIAGVGSTPSDPNPSLVYPTNQGIMNAIAAGRTLPGNITLRWSFQGPIAGMVCTKFNEPSEPAASTWDDDYVCASKDIGLQYSFAGPIAGMTCINTDEPSDVHQTSGLLFKTYTPFWADNYLCLPNNSPISLSWGFAGAPAGRTRLWVMEPAEAWKSTWFDNVIYW